MSSRWISPRGGRASENSKLEIRLNPYLVSLSKLPRVDEARICLRYLSPPLSAEGHAVLSHRADGRRVVGRCDDCAFLECRPEHNRAPLDQSETNLLVRAACQPTFAAPLTLSGLVVGLLMLEGGTSEAHYHCEWLADEIMQQINRLEFSGRMRGRLGSSLALINASGTLKRLTHFIEEASSRPLPVLVLGEPGSETDEVACAIHLLDRVRTGPWVILDCAATPTDHFRAKLEQTLEAARGGTLYLARIHRLTSEAQARLASTLHHKTNRWIVERGLTHEPRVRLIASVRLDLDSLLADRLLDVCLLGELDFLRGRVEPLRRRREDIRPLASYLLDHLGGPATATFTEEAWRLLEYYSWPYNTLELRCLLGRLLTLCHRRPIDASSLLRHAPRLRKIDPRSLETGLTPPVKRGLGARLPPATWIQIQGCASSDRTAPKTGHEALDRALEYIDRKSGDRLTVTAIARHGYLSSSHLSALFQRHLKLSPMAFVAAVRVERARTAILAAPYRSITEVAASTGFGDLRHLERTFKRWLNATPRQLRDQARREEHEEDLSQRS